ncbi:MAG: phosphotransferase [Dehalococcoidia bacterium]|nr:phosphotransferase [Dehalococcoidia bacterium]
MNETRELRKVAEGREAEMFAWEDGSILRLLREPGAEQRNQGQAAAIEAARSRGVRVPAVLGATTVLGRPGLIMERIEGPDLLTLIGRRPWTAFRVGRICGEVHAQLHEVRAPSAIDSAKESLREAIERPGLLPGPVAEFALNTLDGLPDGDALCHGDFHPGNILMAGETPVLIDWTNAMRGDPAADVARTRMMLRLGEAPPGTSFALRALARVGRSLLVTLYLRSYRRARPLDMDAVNRWEVPVAAARLAEGIEEEVPRLLALLKRAAGGSAG